MKTKFQGNVDNQKLKGLNDAAEWCLGFEFRCIFGAAKGVLLQISKAGLYWVG